MRIILNGPAILSLSGLDNVNQLALKSGVSPQLAYKYINRGNEMSSIDGSILGAILTRGCGLQPEQIADLAVGEIFKVVD